jgi:GxxExxY protein
MKDNSHPHMELTEKLIGAAMTVHRELGPGLDEKIYENAFCIEMAELSIPFTQQKQYPVHYRSRYVGKLITDLVADERVILELKVADNIHQTHVAQLLSKLAITKLQVGLIFNFKPHHSPSNVTPTSIENKTPPQKKPSIR